ncbi:MAG: radical SAM protein, partial [Actinobacteria bacterium]|nr:radical SAM protein [Actinomycetota bacterium]
DAREPVAHLQVDPASPAPCVILHSVVRHVTVTVRPDDVLAALRRVADLEPPVPPRVTRLAQGPLDEATCTVGDPFAPDRRG